MTKAYPEYFKPAVGGFDSRLGDWTEDEKDSLALIIICHLEDVASGTKANLKRDKLWLAHSEQFYRQCNHSKATKSLRQLWFEELRNDEVGRGEVSPKRWRSLDDQIWLDTGACNFVSPLM